MSLLRIHLPNGLVPASLAGDNALLAQSFAFVAIGDPGALGATRTPGNASLAAMPAATDLEVLLPAAAVRLARIKVPRVRGNALKRVLPNLVEDLMIGDPADTHIVPLGSEGADGLRELAFAMRDWIALAQRIVKLRNPKRAVVLTEALLVPSVPFLVCSSDGGGYLRHARGVLPFAPVAENASGTTGPTTTVPPELRLAEPLLKDPARNHVSLPVSGLTSMLAQSWSQQLGIVLEPMAWHWTTADPAPATLSLLQFEYAGSAHDGSGGWRDWRWPIGLAIAAGLVCVLGLNLQWLQLSQERSTIEARMRSDFQTAFPNVPINTSPVLLAQRELAKVSATGDDNFFVLASALANAVEATPGKPALRALEYRAGALRAKLATGQNAQQVADRVRAAGFDANAEAPAADAIPVVLVRKRAAG